MQLSTTIRLNPTSKTELLSFISKFNEAVNYCSRIAFEKKIWNWFELQRLTYHEVKKQFCLSGEATTVAIRKASLAYKNKQRRNKKATFKQLGAIPIQCHRYKKDSTVRIYGMNIPFSCKEWVSSKKEATLSFRNNKFILYQTTEIIENPVRKVKDYIGYDLGIENLVTDSLGKVYSGSSIEKNRQIYIYRRKNLQRKQTRAAKRKLKLLAGKQSRYQRDVNHKISKEIVEKAKQLCCGIALEDLSGIRSRITARRRQRNRLHNWSFYQLQSFIVYKARIIGIPVSFVNAAYTSQKCSKCGCIDRKSRSTRDKFICVSCCYTADADYNAARNIRARALGNAPNSTVYMFDA